MRASREAVDTLFIEDAPSRKPLQRIIQDTENISSMARAIAALNSASKWVWVGLGKALKASPQALIKVMNGVKVANEIARLLTKRWNDFQTDITNFGHDQMDKTANAVIETVKIARAKLNPTPPPVDPEIQKAAEAEAEKLLKQNKPVPDVTALNVRNLNLMNRKFTNVALLDNIKWLRSIDLDGTKIANFTPLRSLKHLTKLDIRNTKITDLAPISGLEKLQALYLNSTGVTDWSSVAHVKHVYGRSDDWDK